MPLMVKIERILLRYKLLKAPFIISPNMKRLPFSARQQGTVGASLWLFGLRLKINHLFDLFFGKVGRGYWLFKQAPVNVG